MIARRFAPQLRRMEGDEVRASGKVGARIGAAPLGHLDEAQEPCDPAFDLWTDPPGPDFTDDSAQAPPRGSPGFRKPALPRRNLPQHAAPSGSAPSDDGEPAGVSFDLSASLRPDAARRRGRGATINPEPRFESLAAAEVDDGWGSLGEMPPFTTEVTVEKARSIITRNDSPDLGFDRSVNPLSLIHI